MLLLALLLACNTPAPPPPPTPPQAPATTTPTAPPSVTSPAHDPDAPALISTLLPPGGQTDALRRGPEHPLAKGIDHESPALAITPQGQVFAVEVALEDGGQRERLYLHRAPSPDAPFAAPRAISKGVRAWAPRLTSGPNGTVWVTWCGRQQLGDRDDLSRQVYLRELSGPGPIIAVTDSPARSCNPDLAVQPDGTVVVAWEEHTQIASRSLHPSRPPANDGPQLTAVEILSSGRLNRRPSVALDGGHRFIAWDSLVDPAPARADDLATPHDPDYDVLLRIDEGPTLHVDSRPGIQAAPRLIPYRLQPDSPGVAVVYHSSHHHSLVKWWQLRHLDAQGSLSALAPEDPMASALPSGELQGAEFPELVRWPDGALLVLTRASHGLYAQLIDGDGVSSPANLATRPWGARGLWAPAALAPDGSVLLARRARREAQIDRLWRTRASGPPRFEPVQPFTKTAREAAAYDPPLAGPLAPGDHIFYGDVHMHSAISDGTGPPDEIYARAWVRGLDFAILTDHDYLVSRMSASEHDEIVWVSDVFDAFPGFSTLHAFEWTSPATKDGGAGHRNVYWRGYPPSHVPGYKDGAPDTPALNLALAGERALTVPHHASWTGTDWQNFDPDRQRLYEVVSVHGVSEYRHNTPIPPRGDVVGSFAVDGLANGLRYGLIGGSDGHGLLWHHGQGRRRDPWLQGLSGVVAPSGGRSALWDALYARHVFATSGAPMVVLLTADGVAMGDQGQAEGPVTLRWQLRGSRPLEQLTVMRDGVEIHSVDLEGTEVDGSWDDHPNAGDHSYYLRLLQAADAVAPDLAWSSPVFLSTR